MEHTSRFFEFFPPPKYLFMPAVGIALSDTSIRYARLRKEGFHQVLEHYGEKEIPVGVVVEGKVKNPDSLKELLVLVKQELNTPFVRLALPEQHGYLLKLTLPRMKRSKLRGSIELQLEEHVPMDPREAVFDYTTVACLDREKKNMFSAGVSVISQELVTTYLTLFESAGFVPLSLEMEAQAIMRALFHLEDCGTYMVADIGATRTNLSIVSEGIVQYTWTIRVGGNLLTGAVAKAFGQDEKTAKMKKEKEGLKRGKQGEDMYAVLTPILRILRDEIAKRHAYWETNSEERGSEQKTIQQLLLCGGEANVPDLPEYLASGLKVRVLKANPWKNITSLDEYIPELPYNHSLRYVTALGLAMRQPS